MQEKNPPIFCHSWMYLFSLRLFKITESKNLPIRLLENLFTDYWNYHSLTLCTGHCLGRQLLDYSPIEEEARGMENFNHWRFYIEEIETAHTIIDQTSHVVNAGQGRTSHVPNTTITSEQYFSSAPGTVFQNCENRTATVTNYVQK